MQNQANGIVSSRPQGLLMLSTCYALFMWTFGYIISNLNLFFQKLLHSTPQTTTQIETKASAYTFTFFALLWILPIIGGYVSQRVGYYKSAVVGLMFCLLATICLSITPVHLASPKLALTLLELSFFLAGNALFTPSIWCLVDHLYQKECAKRESGFTLFYLIFNIGGILGIFITSAFDNSNLAFSICAVTLLCSMLTLQLCKRRITIAAGRSIETQINLSKSKLTLFMLSGTALFSMLISLCFISTETTEFLIYAISIIAIIYLIHLAMQQQNNLAKHKIFGFIILCLFACGFWVLYNLEPSLLSIFIKKTVNTTIHIFNFEVRLPAAAFFGFECIFIVIIGVFLSKLWLKLATQGRDPNLAFKFGLGLLLIATGYIYLSSSINIIGVRQKTPALIIIFSYIFFASGELCVGPIGIAMVGKLAPPDKEGTLMGVWQLVIGVSAIIADDIAKRVIHAASNVRGLNKAMKMSDPHTQQATIGSIHATLTRTSYANTFQHIGAIVICAAILVLALSPWVKKLLGDTQTPITDGKPLQITEYQN
jgi:proton-dependent oligopeptide transporter, POT family